MVGTLSLTFNIACLDVDYQPLKSVHKTHIGNIAVILLINEIKKEHFVIVVLLVRHFSFNLFFLYFCAHIMLFERFSRITDLRFIIEIYKILISKLVKTN